MAETQTYLYIYIYRGIVVCTKRVNRTSVRNPAACRGMICVNFSKVHMQDMCIYVYIIFTWLHLLWRGLKLGIQRNPEKAVSFREIPRFLRMRHVCAWNFLFVQLAYTCIIHDMYQDHSKTSQNPVNLQKFALTSQEFVLIEVRDIAQNERTTHHHSTGHRKCQQLDDVLLSGGVSMTDLNDPPLG